jgi:hypothetical protein
MFITKFFRALKSGISKLLSTSHAEIRCSGNAFGTVFCIYELVEIVLKYFEVVHDLVMATLATKEWHDRILNSRRLRRRPVLGRFPVSHIPHRHHERLALPLSM